MFQKGLKDIDSPYIKSVRGRGLFQAMVIEPRGDKSAWDLCLQLIELGILAKQTHTHIIRFAPPLVINEKEVRQSLDIIEKALQQY